MNRRDFLRASLAVGGAFALGIDLAGCASPATQRMREVAERTGGFQPNAYLTILPDDRVLLAVGKSEMGQGVFTSHAMLVAEELEVPLDRVEVFHAVASPAFQQFGLQMTGGSTSASESFRPIREGAASAREMFLSAAAAQWACPRGECEVAQGVITHEPSGRTLRYGELTQAAAKQEIPGEVALKTRDAFRVIGTDATRVDMRQKIDGSAVFGLDVAVENMARAVVVRPPVLGAQVTQLDADAARAMPGVVSVFAFARGVAVVAERTWQAQRAARAVQVKWDSPRLSRLNTADLARDAAKRSLEPGVSMRDDGDALEAIEGAATTLDVHYSGPYLAHAPLEPQNATAWVREDRCDVWAPIQWQSAAQSDIATLLGLSREQVYIHTTMLGGGFGRRLMIDYAIEAVLIAREVGRPVQVLWSREDDTRGGYYRPLQHAHVRGALDAKGQPIAMHYHALSQSLLDLRDWLPGILPQWVPRLTRVMMARTMGNAVSSDTLPNVLATEGVSDATYALPHLRVEYTQIRTDVSVNFWRSVGHAFNAFAIESFIDELAHAGGQDPVALRLSLLKDDPKKRDALERVAKLGRWGEPIEAGWGRGVAVHHCFGTTCAQVIEARVFEGQIQVRRVCCVVNCGLVINPDIVRAQMEGAIIQGLSAAIYQKIELVNGQVQQGNFDTYPLLRLHETPELVIELVDSAADPTGVGEPGLPPVAPALAGAIFMATGERLRAMPFLDALREV